MDISLGCSEMGFVERSGIGRARTVRIDATFNDELESEAEKKGVSVSRIVECLIEDYINYGRWINRGNGLIVMPSIMKNIIEELDDSTITNLGTILGSSVPREVFMMRGLDKSDEKAEILIMRILGEYENWFSAYYHNNSRAYFYLRSSMGDKWMLFVGAYLAAFFRDSFGIEVECKRQGENLQILI